MVFWGGRDVRVVWHMLKQNCQSNQKFQRKCIWAGPLRIPAAAHPEAYTFIFQHAHALGSLESIKMLKLVNLTLS